MSFFEETKQTAFFGLVFRRLGCRNGWGRRGRAVRSGWDVSIGAAWLGNARQACNRVLGVFVPLICGLLIIPTSFLQVGLDAIALLVALAQQEQRPGEAASGGFSEPFYRL